MLIGNDGEWQQLTRTYSRLTRWIDALFAQNESTLAGLFFFYRFAVGSAVVSVILWTVDIAT